MTRISDYEEVISAPQTFETIYLTQFRADPILQLGGSIKFIIAEHLVSVARKPYAPALMESLIAFETGSEGNVSIDCRYGETRSRTSKRSSRCVVYDQLSAGGFFSAPFLLRAYSLCESVRQLKT